MTWTQEYKDAMRKFMAEKGRKVQFTGQYPEYDFDDGLNVSTYGWTDYDALRHICSYHGKQLVSECEWIVPEGAVLKEKSYSMFADTFSSNDNEVGINVSGCHCKCGKYTDVTLRFVGSVSEVLQSLFGMPQDPEVTL